ncbi:MAG: sigma-54 dependent transcriptional regulator [Gemmatimonadota bacterium]
MANQLVDAEVKSSISVLVVDDEHTLRESCGNLLRAEGYQVEVCGRGDDAQELLRRKPFDLVLLDLYMSQVPGMEILASALEANPDTIVIVMTGNPSVESSIEALRAGAWDYIPKPFSATHLQILMGRAAHAVTVARESRAGQSDPLKSAAVDGRINLLGVSAAFQRVVELARKVARTDASVFITGESGSGKEVIAQFIHHNSRRSSREMIPLNCAALPETLLESEMFGHVEGAFTGAVKEKIGLLEAANGGTLFLDELTEMPLPIQAKLLRVIQDGVVRRLGSTSTDAVVNVRFLAGTNEDPMAAVEKGKLRRDLYYRLRVVPIHIPPLRERPEDIPVLAEHFLKQFWKQHRGANEEAPRLTDQAIDALLDCPWRGNVRELRNVMEHSVVLLQPGVDIEADQIPFIDRAEGAEVSGSGNLLRDVPLNQDYHTAREQVLAEFEKGYLQRIVRTARGNMSDAARIAGVDRTTLYRLMQKHGLDRHDLLTRGD